MNDREIMDITVKYHVKGTELMKWQNLTKVELLAILDHVTNAVRNDAKLESFSIERNLYF